MTLLRGKSHQRVSFHLPENRCRLYDRRVAQAECDGRPRSAGRRAAAVAAASRAPLAAHSPAADGDGRSTDGEGSSSGRHRRACSCWCSKPARLAAAAAAVARESPDLPHMAAAAARSPQYERRRRSSSSSRKTSHRVLHHGAPASAAVPSLCRRRWTAGFAAEPAEYERPSSRCGGGHGEDAPEQNGAKHADHRSVPGGRHRARDRATVGRAP